VILACRSAERAQAARDDIVKSTGNDDVIVMVLDLASLSSVRQFADQFNRSAFPLTYVILSCSYFMSKFLASMEIFTCDNKASTCDLVAARVNELPDFLLTLLQ